LEVPRSGARPYGWQRWIDTALPSPEDLCTLDEAPPVTDGTYRVQSHSCVVLVSQLPQSVARAQAE